MNVKTKTMKVIKIFIINNLSQDLCSLDLVEIIDNFDIIRF